MKSKEQYQDARPAAIPPEVCFLRKSTSKLKRITSAKDLYIFQRECAQTLYEMERGSPRFRKVKRLE